VKKVNSLDIVIAGVGGQGTLLASRVLGALALELGMDVKVSEVHGMAQRGGSVISFVRIGENVAAPLVDPGGADYVLAFEKLEAGRAAMFLKRGGTLIANTRQISPMPVITGEAEYPADILKVLEGACNLRAFNAEKLARAAGEPRAANLTLLGALAGLTDFNIDIWRKAIETCVPGKLLDANMRAFDLGLNASTNGDI
jgi:indolepyruvate ferredoxin oxidoreductase beta subunit